MQWKAPSEKTQMVMLSPIIFPCAALMLVAIVVLSPVWFPLHLYRKWLDRKGWHNWFAWRPIFDDGDFFTGREARWIWLETVERWVPKNSNAMYRSILTENAG